MDNAQKAIMIGVGLFITIIVIAAVMLITGIGQDLLNSGTNQLSSVSDTMQMSTLNSYDGMMYRNGNLARNAANDIISLGYNVKIKNSSGEGGNYSTAAPLMDYTYSDDATDALTAFFKSQKYKVEINNTTAYFVVQ